VKRLREVFIDARERRTKDSTWNTGDEKQQFILLVPPIDDIRETVASSTRVGSKSLSRNGNERGVRVLILLLFLEDGCTFVNKVTSMR
jgi:hypothetical protein